MGGEAETEMKDLTREEEEMTGEMIETSDL